ncbi:MAG: type 1 glutamine amidotransferase [Bryobacteraceae bacterium]|nr:type 1 glutamine amidotransferase [Bryobacteraceae bacterium]MDW8376884.1 type 1 glutamine amidotransferase [Bryobacterales bacterium]
MSILVCRHSASEHLGRLKPILYDFSLDYQYFDASSSPSASFPADPADLPFEGVVILGGAASANDDWAPLRWEYRLIEQALARNVPLLGICLGAQMIAKVLGAKVYRAPQAEIGWFSVEFLPPAANDRLFGTLRREMFFQWHAETFDLPGGAVHLARSSGCENQAFRFGDRTWGVQFHPEVTPAMISQWLEEDARCENPECSHPAAFHPAPRRIVRRAAKAASRVFAGFCQTVLDWRFRR